MNEFMELPIITGDLDSQSDEALCGLIDKAGKILKDRKVSRKREAIAEIKRIARMHGVDVSIGKPARKRGRPARPETEN